MFPLRKFLREQAVPKYSRRGLPKYRAPHQGQDTLQIQARLLFPSVTTLYPHCPLINQRQERTAKHTGSLVGIVFLNL